MARMVEMVIDSVRVSLTNQQRIVVLRETNAERFLPIWIGPYEAESITIALQDVEVSRPQTHDLLKNALQAVNAKLLRIEVISLRDDVFYGNLVIEIDEHTVEVDCRPSDALALAVRAHVPIMVLLDVLESAGITPEKEGKEPDQSISSPSAKINIDTAAEESGEERLSVFEDFLDKLNLDNLNPHAKGDKEEDDDIGEDKPKSK
jgi:uncharacterized protein